MKFPKILIPFLAVVLPTVHFANNDINGNQSYSKKDTTSDDKEITSDETETQGILLRTFKDSERFLRFAKHNSHTSHTSHTAHSAHKSHTSHRSGNHNSGSDCNGCWFNVEDEEIQESTNLESLIALK